ncbi:hypothetical protein MKEN_00179500 [Mycena kentingensis (nom. inval.)]|nr:hypothetical protein MKEN_00179500 [Mycena kentingensis (nom. inval.)]
MLPPYPSIRAVEDTPTESPSFTPQGVDLWTEKTLPERTLFAFLSLPRSKIPWRMVVYVLAIFALATVGYGSAAVINQQAFIDDRGVPGGPAAWEFVSFTSAQNMMGVIAYVLLSWLADGLVLWRFSLIFGSKWVWTAFPATMFFGAIVSSIGLVISSFQLTDSFWAIQSVRWGTAYWSLSIALNLLLTTGIVVRISLLRVRIRRSLGAQHADRYFGIVAMMIESASLYAVFGVGFLVAYARASVVQNLVFPVLGQVQGIAPMLILARVAEGRAWSQSVIQNTGPGGGSTINLAPGGGGAGATAIPLGSVSRAATMHGHGQREGVKVNVRISTEVASSDESLRKGRGRGRAGRIQSEEEEFDGMEAMDKVSPV